MRILFTCAAGLGHVFPLVPLARAAVAAGDQVLFAVPSEGIVTVEGLGFAATVIPDGDPRDIGKAWSELPDHDVNTYVVADIFVRVQALAALPALQAAISDHRADLVVTTEFGGIVAAESCGVPNALVGITALDLADLDMARVSDAVDDLREAAGLRRTGQLPYATGSHYLSAIPPMLWADNEHLPPGWIWYRHEDAEGPVAPARPDSDRSAAQGIRHARLHGRRKRTRPAHLRRGTHSTRPTGCRRPVHHRPLRPQLARTGTRQCQRGRVRTPGQGHDLRHRRKPRRVGHDSRRSDPWPTDGRCPHVRRPDSQRRPPGGRWSRPARRPRTGRRAAHIRNRAGTPDPTYRNNARQIATDIATRPTPTQALNRIRTILAR